MTTDDDLAAARLLLQRMGISPKELIEFERRATATSLRELVSTVSGVVPEGSRKVYAPYWRKALKAWPDAQVGEISQTATSSGSSNTPRRARSCADPVEEVTMPPSMHMRH